MSNSETDTERVLSVVGVVGLGNMGAPMAANLVAAGHDVIVYDVDRGAAERFVAEHKARAAETPADLTETEVLILMLPNGAIVRDVLVGQGGLAEALQAGTMIIDMSSSSAAGTTELGEELTARGFRFVDAPVSGGVPRARTGSLAIMAGGSAEDVAALRPVFEPLSSSVTHVGGLGSGHAMKALNNFVSAAGLVAACEALRIGEAFGIPGETVIEVLNSSTGRNNSTENKLAQYVLHESYNSGFSLSLMRKDLEAAVDLAGHLKIELPMGHDLLNVWTRADAELGAGVDHTAIARLVSRQTTNAD